MSLAISSSSSCRSSSLILSANEGINVLHSSAPSQQREPMVATDMSADMLVDPTQAMNGWIKKK